jgi:hypothetical protein
MEIKPKKPKKPKSKVSSLPNGGWIERLVRYQKVGTFRHYINLGGLPTQHYGMCPHGIRIGTSTEFG